MCGIIGYSGTREAAPILVESLRRLEYRGYDSVGVAVLTGKRETAVIKSDRKVDDLERLIAADGTVQGTVGIGHTRWATHGQPTVVNAHPLHDCTGRIHLIHNGIIENYRELRDDLILRGHHYSSQTDTEVLTHLIEEAYDGDLARAVRIAVRSVKGAYALVVMTSDQPDLIVGARQESPLVVGIGDQEVFVSSDITALLPYTRDVVVVEDGQVISCRPGHLDLWATDGSVCIPKVTRVEWDATQAKKDGYPHFFLKEMHDQPASLKAALAGRISSQGHVTVEGLSTDELLGIDHVTVVACGSARYAGGVLKTAMERWARLRTEVVEASEFRYSDPVIDAKTLVIAISQSGETADTLAAVREARLRGARVVGVTNVVGSALSRLADDTLMMQAGPEISVAATKTFSVQALCGLLIALAVAVSRKQLTKAQEHKICRELQELPRAVEEALELEPQIAQIASSYARVRQAIFIARGANVPTALEGALKLKELAYVSAEAHPAGELKHGPIALLEEAVPVVAIMTQSNVLEKMVSNVQECRVRSAPIVGIVTRGNSPIAAEEMAAVIEVPPMDDILSPLVNVVPLQFLAYYMAVERGCDVDQPRNLAKSVTVE